MNKYIFVIIVYSVLMVIASYLFTKFKKVKSAGDFFVARRSLSSNQLFATLLAANIGAGSTIGLAGLAYKHGISAWWWIGASGLGSIFLAFLVGPKIYEFAKKRGFLTLGDYLEFRYSKGFRSVISIFMGVGTLAIFGGQLLAIAWILQVISGLSKEWGVLLGAAVVVVYSAIGGLFSAVVVNSLQIVVKVIGFTLAAGAAYHAVGGFAGLAEKLAAVSANNTLLAADGIGITSIIGFFLMLTPSFCISSGLIGKVYGAKDVAAVKRGTALNGIAQWAFGLLIVFIGMSAYALFPNLDNGELALPTAIINMMPFWVAAIALASIFSAEVSTCDAVLYMIVGSWVNDIYKGVINPNISETKLLTLSRIAMGVAGGMAVIFALILPNVIGALTIFYTLMSVSLTAPLFFGLFTKTADSGSALISSILGIAVMIIFKFFTDSQGVWILNAQSTGILASIAVFAVLIAAKKLRI